jgi:hypothetical protein
MLSCFLHLAAAAGVRPVIRSPARPAFRLGGEWAGHCVAFADRGMERAEVLTTETWGTDGVGGEPRIHRRSAHVQPGFSKDHLGPTVSHSFLPPPCSGSIVLRPGNAMFEPDVLNARGWALDARGEDGLWVCETVFDGLGGDRPAERAGALECPVERTRVECTFCPIAGTLSGASRVWQERCWSAGPSTELEVHDLDAEWVSSAVGIESFSALEEAGGDLTHV